MPSYFCEDVVAAARTSGIRVSLYADGPWTEVPLAALAEVEPGDVVLVADYFGHRASLAAAIGSLPAGCVSISDHTHDPWSPAAFEKGADYCFASLRKTLPLPDGGVLWSHRHALPSPPSRDASHETLAESRAEGMRLKAAYLRGERVEKEAFRARFTESEPRFATAPPAAMSEVGQALLSQMDVQALRSARRPNHATLLDLLRAADRLEALHPDVGADAPLGLVIVCETASDREALRSRLIQARIYPAVLWTRPESHPFPRDLDHASRMLLIHCDSRYVEADLVRVADVCLGGAS
jgi:hypothetical protein